MFYELRHYDPHSDRHLDLLNARLQNHALPLWQTYGIEPVGFWTAFLGPRIPRLTYALRWETLGDRQERWDAFTSDPNWRQAASEGSLTRSISSIILKPTDFSHLPRHDNQPARLSGGIFELHVCEFADGEKLRQAVEWFGASGLPHMTKHGLFSMAFWTTYLGVSPRLTYMLVFENLAHRERAWAGFYTDPAWPDLQNGLYPGDVPLIASTEICVMKGTEFSGWR